MSFQLISKALEVIPYNKEEAWLAQVIEATSTALDGSFTRPTATPLRGRPYVRGVTVTICVRTLSRGISVSGGRLRPRFKQSQITERLRPERSPAKGQ